MAQTVDSRPSDAPVDYRPGEMDVMAHRSMYHRFNTLVHWASLSLAMGLTFFILLLCVHVGFLPSLIAAVVVFAVGAVWLRSSRSNDG